MLCDAFLMFKIQIKLSIESCAFIEIAIQRCNEINCSEKSAKYPFKATIVYPFLKFWKLFFKKKCFSMAAFIFFIYSSATWFEFLRSPQNCFDYGLSEREFEAKQF